jgi:hypothetical protein
MSTDHVTLYDERALPSASNLTRRTALLDALAVVSAMVAYAGLTTYILHNSSSRVYGFPVSHDIRTLIEIALQISPMLAAFVTVLLSPGRDRIIEHVTRRAVLHRPNCHLRALRILSMVAVNAMFALAFVAVTACAVTLVCGVHSSAPKIATCLWVAAELAIDITLIGIFTTMLYALTRRLWRTILLFVGYVIFVVSVGPTWGITSYIGFGSGVPVMLTTYSAAPLYDGAGWLFRAYWSCAVLLMLSVLYVFDRPRCALLGNLRNAVGESQSRRALMVSGALLLSWIGIGAWLVHLQRYGIARYHPPLQAALENAVGHDAVNARLHLTHYDLRLKYTPNRSSVGVEGVLTLTNDNQALSTAYLQLPAPMRMDDLRLTATGPYEVIELGKYIQIRFRNAFGAGKQAQLRYTGVIEAAGPFDLTVQAKVFKNAFFLTDADILMAPRSAACLTSAESQGGTLTGDPACGPAENYLMSDQATGRIRVTTPAGLDVVRTGASPVRNMIDDSLEEHSFTVAAPQLATFMVACAPFAKKPATTPDGGTRIHVYRSAAAPDEGNLETTLVQSILSYYRTVWPAYPRDDLSIIETPTPLGEALAFDGGIAVSDKIISSRNPISGAASNLLEFVLAHEIAHQWWGYQVVPARSPGRLFLLESFPQFAAYQYLNDRGVLNEQDAMRNEQRRYEAARNRYGTRELTLAQFEARPEYAYNKGPFVLLSLGSVGQTRFMSSLGDLIARHSHATHGNTDPDEFVGALINALPESGRETARALIYGSETQRESAR